MKKVLLTLLAVVVILGMLAGAGFAGYRYGYIQGASGEAAPFARGHGLGWQRMPMHNFERGIAPGFQRGFGPGGFGMMDRGGGFWFFSPWRLLIQIAVLGLVVWLVYKLLTGWRLTLTRAADETPRAEPVEAATKSGKDAR